MSDINLDLVTDSELAIQLINVPIKHDWFICRRLHNELNWPDLGVVVDIHQRKSPLALIRTRSQLESLEAYLLVNVVAGWLTIELNTLEALSERRIRREVSVELEFSVDGPFSESGCLAYFHLVLVRIVGLIVVGLEEFSVDLDGVNWIACANIIDRDRLSSELAWVAIITRIFVLKMEDPPFLVKGLVIGSHDPNLTVSQNDLESKNARR
jgi:hypothetical protein